MIWIFRQILTNKKPPKKHKIIIFLDDIIADMRNNKNLNPIAAGLFIRGRKLNNLYCFYYRLILLY